MKYKVSRLHWKAWQLTRYRARRQKNQLLCFGDYGDDAPLTGDQDAVLWDGVWAEMTLNVLYLGESEISCFRYIATSWKNETGVNHERFGSIWWREPKLEELNTVKAHKYICSLICPIDTVTCLSGMKMFKGDICVPYFEAINLKKLEFPQESHPRRESLKPGPARNFFPRKRFATYETTL